MGNHALLRDTFPPSLSAGAAVGGRDLHIHPPIAAAREAATRLLSLADPAVVDVVLAVLIANQIDGDALWMVLVAPPSSGKTELLVAASYAPDSRLLSTLTKKTLISGYKLEGGTDREPSLLEQLKHKTLILKDFTTIMTLHRDDRSEILGVLREAYDGRVSKSFGNLKTYEWAGKMGLLAGCTPAIDGHWAVLSALGERFVFFRLPSGGMDERLEQARKALEASGNGGELRKELGEAMKRAYEEGFQRRGENQGQVTISRPAEKTLIALAELVARGRAPVQRDGYTRGVVGLPEPEGPGRLVKQLRQLMVGLCIIHGKHEPGEEELAILRKVARDTMPPLRATILGALGTGAAMTQSDLQMSAGLPRTTAARELEDCQLLRLVVERQGTWQLSEDARRNMEDCGILS